MQPRPSSPRPSLAADAAPDRAILERLRDGDESALGLVISHYQAILFRYVDNMLHSREMAEDILQEIFIQLWNTRSRIDPTLPIRPYLYRIARNITLDTLSSTTARKYRESRVGLEHVHVSESPASALESQELDQEIQRAIDTLPPRCKEIFVLVRASGLTYTEVADLLGVSISTVKTQMGRAMTTLASRLLPLLSSILLLWQARL